MRSHDSPSATLCAIEQANRLACSPFVFQATYCLREFGILDFLDKTKEPASLELLQQSATQKLSLYALKVLTELGTAFNLLSVKGKKYSITKEARFLINDPMTRANFDFAHDVCYVGLDKLKDALIDGKPDGLNSLYSGAKTIYPIISKLPEPARTSWFKFDHFYSDASYDASLPFLFSNHPKHICDIGGNTGKFALKCCRYEPNVHVTIFDLPEQCAIAKKNADEAGFKTRIDTCPLDLLNQTPLPKVSADIWWMSQLLDCFSEDQIVSILQRVRDAMNEKARICILEPLIGEQPFEIGNACLTAFSLYFTALANGTSKFYSLTDFEHFARSAELTIETVHHNLGTGHSLLVLKRTA